MSGFIALIDCVLAQAALNASGQENYSGLFYFFYNFNFHRKAGGGFSACQKNNW
ncbi:hypothetical protein [Pantoea sp. B65]|uniref:hypothetical protein n=1 Tax=Pantoea sp. B65 TaxID=2813359 RepID=UPI0039B6E172